MENKASIFSHYSQFIDHRYHLHSLQAQVVPDQNSEYTYCVYDSDIATGYGVGAFLFLFASQALIMAATRCLSCGRSLKPGGSCACAIVLFIGT